MGNRQLASNNTDGGDIALVTKST